MTASESSQEGMRIDILLSLLCYYSDKTSFGGGGVAVLLVCPWKLDFFFFQIYIQMGDTNFGPFLYCVSLLYNIYFYFEVIVKILLKLSITACFPLSLKLPFLIQLYELN